MTAADFHVGARLVDETQSEVLMTVGGVRRARRRAGSAEAEIRLAVHHPSERPSSGGLVRVHELFDEAGDYADLAEGLELGTMQAGAAEDDVSARGSAEREPWIEPQLDYLDGLFHVVVLCPPEPRFGSAIPFETVLRDEHWLRVRPLSVGDPSTTRSTCKIRAGTGKGVRAGAAVTSVGANLIGRVVHAGPASSDVAYLDDPLFNVVAIARFEGLDEPKVLGRLESRGVDRTSGTVRFRWIVRVSLEDVEPLEGDARPARLFTGSADPGLPAGFSFGHAWIPVDARPGEERELEVTPSVDPREVHTLFVRTLSVGERGSSPGAGA